jgi:D-3-phosphoglycerate dehydrogenase / 2-oxoglutarate reductase
MCMVFQKSARGIFVIDPTPGEAFCYIVQPVHEAGLQFLLANGLPSATSLGGFATENCVAVITRNAGLSGAAIERLPNLRVIAVHGIGVDPVDLLTATRRGVAVTHTPSTNVRSVAEHAIALTLTLAKQLVASDAATRAGDFTFKYRNQLVELDSLTFGVVGFGSIGRATAQLARAFGMRVVASSKYQPDSVFEAIGVERAHSLEDVLRTSDVVSLHLPSNAATRVIIGAREISMMRPGAILINTGRGDVVDEGALIEALSRRAIRGAGLDVYQNETMSPAYPLLHLPNVVLSPHSAGSTEASLRRTALEAARCVIDVLKGRRPTHLVNPNVWPQVSPLSSLLLPRKCEASA